ncbi:MAG: NAD+ synthase [Alphaproteobacteria bacterium GM202ARS2]|nr:NAD+ synthase [Alphaproteobacteria bacterium GM202ARS2]
MLTIALCQTDSNVGAIDHNTQTLLQKRQEAAKKNAHLLVTSELFLSGYPPEDLLLHPPFLSAIQQAVTHIAAETKKEGPAILLGTPWQHNDHCINAALLLQHGRIQHIIAKSTLPNYGVFDEKRVFHPAPHPSAPIPFHNHRCTILICEDLWHATDRPTPSPIDSDNTDLIIVLNASPFEPNKLQQRQRIAQTLATHLNAPLFYVNTVGGQDELLFDGGSFIIDSRGHLTASAPQWQEAHLVASYNKETNTLTSDPSPARHSPPTPMDSLACDYHGLLCGIASYCRQSGLPHVLLGLSGGIDSALVATLAVDSLGASCVHAIMMPSPYTSELSRRDAHALAHALGLQLEEVAIDDWLATFDTQLRAAQGNKQLARQNIQARLRGLWLMAQANLHNRLLLATGNKSEYAMGYATLYGDMCGGLAPLKDVYKTRVYALARWRQQHKPHPSAPDQPFTESLLTKAPSAELAPNQKDSDDMPDYAILDPLLYQLLEGNAEPAALTSPHLTSSEIIAIWQRVINAEYKRRQAPPGLKLSSCLFGRDRRYPLLNHYQRAPTPSPS